MPPEDGYAMSSPGERESRRERPAAVGQPTSVGLRDAPDVEQSGRPEGELPPVGPRADKGSVGPRAEHALATGPTGADTGARPDLISDLGASAGAAHTRAPEAVRIPDLPHVSLLSQIGEGVLKASELSRLTLHLRPPDLGAIEIAVEARDGALSAHFHSTHPVVHSWLDLNLSMLRAQLAEAGLALNDMTLSTSAHQQGGHSAGQQALSAQPQPGASPGRWQDQVSPGFTPGDHDGDYLVDCFA
jgi:hypothetical protein